VADCGFSLLATAAAGPIGSINQDATSAAEQYISASFDLADPHKLLVCRM
jgi:hypothetical protein